MNENKNDATSDAHKSATGKRLTRDTVIHDGEFVDYVVSILGLKESTARSYDKYVLTAQEILGDAPEEIVKSDESMRRACARLVERGLAGKTVANVISGLKAYFKFKNGCAYSERGNSNRDSACETPDVPYELLEQQNELELKLQEREDSFMGRIFGIALLVLTIVPALVVGQKLPKEILLGFKCALVSGAIGTACLIPAIRRSSRQLKEVVEYGKRIRSGAVTNREFSPSEKTFAERWGFVAATVFLIVAFACILGSTLRMN